MWGGGGGGGGGASYMTLYARELVQTVHLSNTV